MLNVRHRTALLQVAQPSSDSMTPRVAATPDAVSGARRAATPGRWRRASAPVSARQRAGVCQAARYRCHAAPHHVLVLKVGQAARGEPLQITPPGCQPADLRSHRRRQRRPRRAARRRDPDDLGALAAYPQLRHCRHDESMFANWRF